MKSKHIIKALLLVACFSTITIQRAVSMQVNITNNLSTTGLAAQNQSNLTYQLLQSVQEDNIDILLYALRSGADALARQEGTGLTILHLAAWQQRANLIRALLHELPIDVKTALIATQAAPGTSYAGATAIHFAAKHEDPNTLQAILTTEGIAQETWNRLVNIPERKFNASALRIAADCGNAESYHLLIGRGASPMQMAKDNLTPSYITKINEQFIQAEGKLLLVQGALTNDIEKIAKAIRKKANIFTQNKNGRTALHLAAMKGHIRAAHFLLQNAQNNQYALLAVTEKLFNETAEELARRYGHHHTANFLAEIFLPPQTVRLADPLPNPGISLDEELDKDQSFDK